MELFQIQVLNTLRYQWSHYIASALTSLTRLLYLEIHSRIAFIFQISRTALSKWLENLGRLSCYCEFFYKAFVGPAALHSGLGSAPSGLAPLTVISRFATSMLCYCIFLNLNFLFWWRDILMELLIILKVCELIALTMTIYCTILHFDNLFFEWFRTFEYAWLAFSIVFLLSCTYKLLLGLQHANLEISWAHQSFTVDV